MARKHVFGWALFASLVFLIPALAPSRADEPSHVFQADTTNFQLETGIPISFTNGADDPVGVIFLCFTWLQGLSESEWVDLFTPDCSHIRIIPEPVLPGETYEAVFPLEGVNPDTLLGRESFRLRSTLYRRGQPDEEILSEPFVLSLD